jgi:hypothetical protein
MKMREPHIVPLSRQAAEILREVQRLTGNGRWVFPQLRNPDRPMSECCITAALRAMGYAGTEMSWHGFRSLASTQLHELGWNDRWIETQLSHADRNKVGGSYNHAKYLPQRRTMMQAWADYLVRLKEGAVSSWARAHPATVAPAGSNRSSRGGNETAEASGVEGHVSDLASTQAVT